MWQSVAHGGEVLCRDGGGGAVGVNQIDDGLLDGVKASWCVYCGLFIGCEHVQVAVFVRFHCKGRRMSIVMEGESFVDICLVRGVMMVRVWHMGMVMVWGCCHTHCHRNKTSNENHWKDHCGQALVGIYWGINCIGNEKRFLLCSQVWHSLIFCQSRFSEQRSKTRSRAVWSCCYHEVSKMWVMWNPTICIHNVSRPERDMITVGADINECFIFFKIIYISVWKK